jgi:hypothetical protein
MTSTQTLITYPELCALVGAKPTTNSVQRKRQLASWSLLWDIKVINRKYTATRRTTPLPPKPDYSFPPNDRFVSAFAYSLCTHLLEALPPELDQTRTSLYRTKLTKLPATIGMVSPAFAIDRGQHFDLIAEGDCTEEDYDHQTFFDASQKEVKSVLNRCLNWLSTKRILAVERTYYYTPEGKRTFQYASPELATTINGIYANALLSLQLKTLWMASDSTIKAYEEATTKAFAAIGLPAKVLPITIIHFHRASLAHFLKYTPANPYLNKETVDRCKEVSKNAILRRYQRQAGTTFAKTESGFILKPAFDPHDNTLAMDALKATVDELCAIWAEESLKI